MKLIKFLKYGGITVGIIGIILSPFAIVTNFYFGSIALYLEVLVLVYYIKFDIDIEYKKYIKRLEKRKLKKTTDKI